MTQTNRDLAQLVERHPYKVDVIGSNPVVPTNFLKPEFRYFKSTPYTRIPEPDYNIPE